MSPCDGWVGRGGGLFLLERSASFGVLMGLMSLPPGLSDGLSEYSGAQGCYRENNLLSL